MESDEATTFEPAVVRVLIADEQPVVREGFSLLLEAIDGFEVLRCPLDCDDLLREIRASSPDVVLLDMCVAGAEGLPTVRQIKLHHGAVGVLLFPRPGWHEVRGRAVPVAGAAFAAVAEPFRPCGPACLRVRLWPSRRRSRG